MYNSGDTRNGHMNCTMAWATVQTSASSPDHEIKESRPAAKSNGFLFLGRSVKLFRRDARAEEVAHHLPLGV
jgi:hypothetical protein